MIKAFFWSENVLACAVNDTRNWSASVSRIHQTPSNRETRATGVPGSSFRIAGINSILAFGNLVEEGASRIHIIAKLPSLITP